MNQTLASWFLAARPKTLPAAIVPVWLGCVLAWVELGKVDFSLASLTLLGAISIQIATNLFNDLIDAKKGADTERRLGPTRMTATGKLRPQQVALMALGFLAIATGCGVMLFLARGWPILAIGLPSLFLAYGYTGGPFPLAYKGLGEIFVILFFGFIAVGGTYFVQTGQLTPTAILLGAQVGLLSAVLISINNFRDREEDATTGKHTLAVRFGPKIAVAIIWLEIKLAAFLGVLWLVYHRDLWLLSSLPVFLLGMRIIWGCLSQPVSRANCWLAMSALQLIAFAALFHAIAYWAHILPNF